MILKTEWRTLLTARRRSISLRRRARASLLLQKKIAPQGNFLSFSSFGTEIDLSALNQQLASEGRLFLPRIEANNLVPYEVIDLERQLTLSPLGFREPNPELCKKASFSEIECILVPGLGFDPMGYRIGYGMGYYDRLLKANSKILSIAIGFQEQFIDGLLPRDSWDLPTNKLLLT
ncbi:MAG: 5-formyltetrahydrofolate cyclo-ligase [Chlamydiota bacterium]